MSRETQFGAVCRSVPHVSRDRKSSITPGPSSGRRVLLTGAGHWDLIVCQSQALIITTFFFLRSVSYENLCEATTHARDTSLVIPVRHSLNQSEVDSRAPKTGRLISSSEF